MNAKKRLILLSLDAVSSDDLEILQGLPNFALLCKRGTLVKDVSSVLVSNTYPAHTSIITGVHPNKHGIIENVFLSPLREHPKWRYHVQNVKAPTLYDKAVEQGMKVCSILYPVTGGAKIPLHIPEIAGHMPLLKRIHLMLTTGSAGFLLSSLRRFGKQFSGMNEPALDNFTTSIAVDALIRHKPELLMLHLIDVDAQKHDYGPASEQAKDALHRQDERIGRLVRALKKAGTYDESGIIVFSDHGCLPVHTAVDPNDFLCSHGLVRKENGKVTACDAYFHNAGGTAYLRLYNPQKQGLVKHLTEELQGQPYVSRLLTAEEMRISGMDSHHILGIEAADGYSFGEEHLGQHGYGLKREGYYPFYLAAGDGIPQGETISGGCIVDICPLAAQMLDIPIWRMDGINRIEQQMKKH